MKRRVFLEAGAAVAVGISGCLGRFLDHQREIGPLNPPSTSVRTAHDTEKEGDVPRVVHRNFRLLDHYPEKEFDHNGNRFRNAVHVDFDVENDRVVVMGLLKSGQRSCMRTFLQKAAYSRAKDALDVVVVDKVTDPDGPCTSEGAVVPYRLVVEFESGLPKNITIAYNSGIYGDFTKTRRKR